MFLFWSESARLRAFQLWQQRTGGNRSEQSKTKHIYIYIYVQVVPTIGRGIKVPADDRNPASPNMYYATNNSYLEVWCIYDWLHNRSYNRLMGALSRFNQVTTGLHVELEPSHKYPVPPRHYIPYTISHTPYTTYHITIYVTQVIVEEPWTSKSLGSTKDARF